MLADRIVISKTDIADEDAVDKLTARLRELNPRARVIAADYGRLDPGWITDNASARDGAGFLAEAAEVEHTDSVKSFTLTEDAPIAWEPFARAMETLIALRGADLLRVKGFLNVAGCKGPVVVQFVQHIAHPPVELAAWPDGDRKSRVVFITRDIGEREVRDLLDGGEKVGGGRHSNLRASLPAKAESISAAHVRRRAFANCEFG